MKNLFKLILITLPLAAFGLGVLAYFIANSPPPERVEIEERTTAVRVIVAQRQSVAPTVTGFGVVSPARTFEAIAQVGGTVEYVNPELLKGGILPKGDVLLRLSTEDFTLAIAQARANIRAAEAKLQELAVSEQNQIAALTIEMEALALKAAELERTETLFAGGTVAHSKLDTARASHLVQRQKVLSYESALALLPTQRDVQLEQIAVYQANLKTAELNLARTELILPFSARVASVSVEVGQFVKAGQTTAVLDGIAVAEVEAQISVAALRKLLQSTGPDATIYAANPTLMTEVLRGRGLSARVHLAVGQETLDWPATVDRISDTIDPKTGMIGMILQVESAYTGALPGERPPLTKGMFVEATLTGPSVEGIVVPRNAFRDGQVLLAEENNRLKLTPLKAELVQDNVIVIKEGLEEGARVVVSNPSPLIPSMLLDVTLDTDLMQQLASREPAQ